MFRVLEKLVFREGGEVLVVCRWGRCFRAAARQVFRAPGSVRTSWAGGLHTGFLLYGWGNVKGFPKKGSTTDGHGSTRIGEARRSESEIAGGYFSMMDAVGDTD